MAKIKVKQEEIYPIFQSIPLVTEYPSDHIWIDYDREADVLYINLDKPQPATDSSLRDDVLVREKNGKVVGLTVMNASKFKS
jgi:uncharacterized protein YuzE